MECMVCERRNAGWYISSDMYGRSATCVDCDERLEREKQEACRLELLSVKDKAEFDLLLVLGIDASSLPEGFADILSIRIAALTDKLADVNKQLDSPVNDESNEPTSSETDTRNDYDLFQARKELVDELMMRRKIDTTGKTSQELYELHVRKNQIIEDLKSIDNKIESQLSNKHDELKNINDMIAAMDDCSGVCDGMHTFDWYQCEAGKVAALELEKLASEYEVKTLTFQVKALIKRNSERGLLGRFFRWIW